MGFKVICLVLVALAFAGTSNGQQVKKYIYLNEVTSQGILHLPPTSHRDDTPAMCDFWVNFFSDLPEAALPHHKAFGISIVPSQLELADGDSIDILAHPAFPGEDSPHTIFQFEKESWDKSKNFANTNLEFKAQFQDICLNMTGNWAENKSKATLVITLYFDRVEGGYVEGKCPEGMSVCECPTGKNRCIYTDLMCNGAPNCGAVCGHDEDTCSKDEGSSGGVGGQEGTAGSTTVTVQNCKWTAFEYFMMVAVCGLLLILVPSVFILSKMYNRRTEVLAENHRHAHVQYPRDNPPTYNGKV